MTIRDICSVLSYEFSYSGDKSWLRWYAIGGSKERCIYYHALDRSCSKECVDRKANIKDIMRRLPDKDKEKFLFHIVKIGSDK
jgi:hypothetical protein